MAKKATASAGTIEAAEGQFATEINLREGRLILLWPLALQLPNVSRGAADMAGAVRATARRIEQQGAPWIRVADPLQHIAPPTDDPPALLRWQNDAYAEAVYFHEFVQSFLFREQDAAGRNAPFHLFRRTDIGSVKVQFGQSSNERLLLIPRLNLYLFRTGAAVLVLEVHTPLDNGMSGWTLAEFQDFHDHFRRVYAPFFVAGNNSDRHPCPKVPTSVEWQPTSGGGDSGKWEATESVADVEALVIRPDGEGRRYPPIFRHWRMLLSGALPLAGEPAPTGEGRWHQVIDERMPSMATLSLTPVADGKPVWAGRSTDTERDSANDDALRAFATVRDGDLMRLCFADDQGKSRYPYDPEFLLENFWTRHAYTRFRSMGTLYLFSGYAFVAIGAGFDFDSHVMTHVRRHYFQMGLLAHVELASLLAFSSQISRAVRTLDSTNDQESFRLELAAIEEQFLQFVHRFRFTGVSNQIQAQEVFAKWRELLQLEQIFKEVQDEIHTANQFLSSSAQTRMSSAATTLSQVAAIGVILGLAFSMLGMNVVFTGEFITELGSKTKQLAFALAVLGGFMMLGGITLRMLARSENVPSPPGEQSNYAPWFTRAGSRNAIGAAKPAAPLFGIGAFVLLLAACAWMVG